MPHPAWDDVEDFIELDDFASPVVLTLQSGEQKSFPGIFDDPLMTAQTGEYAADLRDPRLTCLESDVRGVSRGDRVVVADKPYDVLDAPHFDGTGTAVLKLAQVEIAEDAL